MPVGVVDQVESIHDRGLLGDRHPDVPLVDGLPATLPAIPQLLMHPRRELCQRKRSVCGEHPDRQLGDLGGKGVGLECRPESTDHGEIVTGGAGGGEHTMAQPEHPDIAEQIVQRRQRGQVVLDGGGPVERMPVRAVRLHGAHHRSLVAAHRE